jgi:predicted lipid-binding transport protein (Tim44 family)
VTSSRRGWDFLAIQGICNADSQHSSPELCNTIKLITTRRRPPGAGPACGLSRVGRSAPARLEHLNETRGLGTLWSSLAATMNREKAQLGIFIMRKLITTIALLALMETSVAIAQTVGSQNPSAPPSSTNPDKQLLPEAPVGHRQPRADQVPSEKNLTGDPNDDAIDRENAALDRMVKAICRGC